MALESFPVVFVMATSSCDSSPYHLVILLSPRSTRLFVSVEAFVILPVHRRWKEDLVGSREFGACEEREEFLGSRDSERIDQRSV